MTGGDVRSSPVLALAGQRRVSARHHAARSMLCWLLAQLLEPPVRAVDLAALGAALELADPPEGLRSVWRAVQTAVRTHQEQDFAAQVGSSCASDLRTLARLGDRACLALVAADAHEHELLLLASADFLAERGGRLDVIAAELAAAAASPYPALGRALSWILADARACGFSTAGRMAVLV